LVVLAGLIKVLTMLVLSLILEGPNPEPIKVSDRDAYRSRRV
jgi:hypothetical protein